MRCYARLWSSWLPKELALLSFDLMLLGIIRRLLLRRGKAEDFNVNGARQVLKSTGEII